MTTQTVHIDPIPVLMIRHRGSYDGIGPVFDDLTAWAVANEVPAGRTIGIYWDNPDHTWAPLLHSAACVEVPHGYITPPTGRLRIENSMIAGGQYVTTRFVGPYEQMAPVWSNFTRLIESQLGYRISSNPAFEVYLNDPSDTPPDQLITDLYMPVV